MVDSSEKGSADIIKPDSGRVFMTQRMLVGMQTVWSSILHLSIWLCVPSQIIGAWRAVVSRWTRGLASSVLNFIEESGRESK